MIIITLTKTLEDSISESSGRQVIDTDVTAKVNERKVIVPDKFKSDITALERYSESSFHSGMSITVTLNELLEICPRERRRADAFRTLIRFLREELGVTLNIKTQKTKENESN